MRTLTILSLAAVVAAQPAPPVRGVVLDELGKPLAGVAVMAFPMHAEFITAELLREPATRTAADGTFALHAGPREPPWPVHVLFVAPGRVHVVAGIAYVDMTPVVLPKAKRLAGRVRDADGKPLAGVRVEARDWLARCRFLGRWGTDLSVSPEPRTAVRTDADGRFVLEGVCDTAVWLLAGGMGFTRREYGPLSAGDPFDAELATAPVVQVHVVDGDGKPVAQQTVRAQASGLPEGLGVASGFTDARGRWAFTFLGAPTRLAVQDDYRVLAHTELAEARAEVRLVTSREGAPSPDSRDATGTPRVFGRVVDPDTGRGVAGARVVLVPPRSHSADMYVLDNLAAGVREPGQRTDTEGRFALPAADGEHWLVASEETAVARAKPHDAGRAPTPLPVSLQPGAALRDLELRLQPTFTVRGTLRGASALPRGTSVRFRVQRPSRWSSESTEFRPRFPLDREGAFVASRLSARAYDVQALVPRPFRQGLPDKVFLESVTVDGTPLEVDARAAVPLEVRGRVNTRMPVQRTAVVVMPTVFDQSLTGLGFAAYDGPVGTVTLDGTFAVRTTGGPRTLLLLDLLTGVVVAQRALGTLLPGEHIEVDLDPEPAPAPLRLRFEGLPASDTLWLDVRVDDAHWPKVGQIGERSPDGVCGVGTRVPRGTTELQLWLPPGTTKLQLRTQQGMRPDGKDVLATVEVDAAKDDEVVMRVP